MAWITSAAYTRAAPTSRELIETAELVELALASVRRRGSFASSRSARCRSTACTNGIATAIARHPRPTLRALTLGDINIVDEGLDGTIGDLEPLGAALPGLECLTLIGRVLAPGRLSLPALRELRIRTNLSTHDSVPAICARPWPSVETLELDPGINTLQPSALRPILDGKTFPQLVHLDLGGMTTSPAVCTALAQSKIAERLESLDLSNTAMEDADAFALATGRFARLNRLAIGNNSLTTAGIDVLHALAETIDL